jgi:NADH-quinone oxidoreductase subunit L
VLLAIPSIAIGYLTVQPLLFGGFFAESIFVTAENDVLGKLASHFENPLAFALESPTHPPFWLALGGVVLAWYLYLRAPTTRERVANWFAPVLPILNNKYYFDWFNEKVLAAGSRGLGLAFWRVGDQAVIDGLAVNGSASIVAALGSLVRRLQTGYLYSYAFWMMIGLAALLGWFLFVS